jgi:DNA-binding transcriptional MerR regulator
MGDGDLNSVENVTGLDYEWILLVKEAKKQGMTIEEIRLFLTEAKRFT